MKKIISLFLIGFCWYAVGLAQASLSKKQFDELWNKADSTAKIVIKTGNATKDLNAVERNNIQAVDIKQKTVTNPNYNFKKVDTSNLELLSTKPIIKGATGKTKTEAPNEAVIKLNKSEVKETEKTKVVEKAPVKIVEPTPVKKTNTDDFSTQPIVKGKKVVTEAKEETTLAPAKKPKLDTTKNFREFTFEGTPVINNNASYNRRDEPMPKSKEQIDDEIPVNRKPNNTNVGKDNSFVKEAYAQYDKEADSLHTANKRRLDSIMQALNIKVPIVINSSDYIDIYVNGGGTIVNGDSKIADHISILHTGIIQREWKTKNDGTQRSEKKISKDELSKLAQYMVDMGFFDLKNDYDCADEDADCNARFSKSPSVVPLEVSMTVGQRKGKVKVAIYAPASEKNYVNYPSNFVKIMNAIYTIVEK